MKGHITVSANDENGITITSYVELDPSSYSEQSTVKTLVDYLLSYEPKTKTEDKEDKE